VRSSYNKIQPG
jgi:hypothetical protein